MEYITLEGGLIGINNSNSAPIVLCQKTEAEPPYQPNDEFEESFVVRIIIPKCEEDIHGIFDIGSFPCKVLIPNHNFSQARIDLDLSVQWSAIKEKFNNHYWWYNLSKPLGKRGLVMIWDFNEQKWTDVVDCSSLSKYKYQSKAANKADMRKKTSICSWKTILQNKKPKKFYGF